MTILALLVALYATIMLLIHVATGRILSAWKEQPDSWISRWFPPRYALRIEGMFWILALAAWFLWRSLPWKVLVVMFAAIHLAIWGAGEFRTDRNNVSISAASPTLRRVIVAFDLLEAFFLAAVAVASVMYLTHAR